MPLSSPVFGVFRDVFGDLWTGALGLDFEKFWTTCDNWKTGILNYFDGRYTSAAVEGINNKGRVITKRCYGVKSAGTFFKRIVLDGILA